MNAHEFYIFFSLGAVRFGGGRRQKCRTLMRQSFKEDPPPLLHVKAFKNDVTLFQRLPQGRSHGVSSLQPQAWQGWDLEYASRLCDPISHPAKPDTQEPCQLTSLHRLQSASYCIHICYLLRVCETQREREYKIKGLTKGVCIPSTSTNWNIWHYFN